MKNYDSRTYNVNDFVEWDRQGQLELNPFFQRRPVWNDKAKSYLIDTIIRGKPMPKVFIRQKINVSTKTSTREVVDGQQRIRTILSFVKDGFSISRNQNDEFGGLKFSQLPADMQSHILSYEISVDLLINLPDAEILDIFGRLNSYAVVLNEQERINATHFGPFKFLVDRIGYRYNHYWTYQRILTPQQILRMQEVSLVADLIIAMQEGIKAKKQTKKYYSIYERSFDFDISHIETNFDFVISTITEIFPEGLMNTEFRRIHVFYSLFTSVAHCLFGLPRIMAPRPELKDESDIQRARNGLDRVGEIFLETETEFLSRDERQFLQDTRRATTDEPVRERRTRYLVGLMG